MATQKQIDANRRNAKKATGPRTPAGKAASRCNALTFGLYAKSLITFDEDAPDLVELAAEFHAQYQPANITESSLVETLINTEWRMRRLRRAEAGLWGYAAETYAQDTEVALLDATIAGTPVATRRVTPGDAFAMQSTVFLRLNQILNACERSFHRTLAKLEQLQAQASTTPSEELVSFDQNVPIDAVPAQVTPAPAPDVERPFTESGPLQNYQNLTQGAFPSAFSTEQLPTTEYALPLRSAQATGLA